MDTNKHIVLISENAGENMGGEAIKALQFYNHLVDKNVSVDLITHERCVDLLGDAKKKDGIYFISEDAVFALLWRVVFLRGFIHPYFHHKVKKLVLKQYKNKTDVILHYICPVSPIQLRFPPDGYTSILGPLTGNIGYPPAFRDRESSFERMRRVLHPALQHFSRIFFGEKARFRKILVSGYDRTVESLTMAGAQERQIYEVVDSGIGMAFTRAPRVQHEGVNTRFCCSGRAVGLKGTDLAIRALAKTDSAISLDVYGDGPALEGWMELARNLGVSDRVNAMGWVRHDQLMNDLAKYRAYVFPTLAEANGIVMQEAMMIGIPVVTLRWGGPARLADDESAVFVEPHSQDHVVDEIARALEKLAYDGTYADQISAKARSIAEAKYAWDRVANSWLMAYEE